MTINHLLRTQLKSTSQRELKLLVYASSISSSPTTAIMATSLNLCLSLSCLKAILNFYSMTYYIYVIYKPDKHAI